jgi:hypothetical protein
MQGRLSSFIVEAFSSSLRAKEFMFIHPAFEFVNSYFHQKRNLNPYTSVIKKAPLKT